MTRWSREDFDVTSLERARKWRRCFACFLTPDLGPKKHLERQHKMKNGRDFINAGPRYLKVPVVPTEAPEAFKILMNLAGFVMVGSTTAEIIHVT